MRRLRLPLGPAMPAALAVTGPPAPAAGAGPGQYSGTGCSAGPPPPGPISSGIDTLVHGSRVNLRWTSASATERATTTTAFGKEFRCAAS